MVSKTDDLSDLSPPVKYWRRLASCPTYRGLASLLLLHDLQ